MTTQSPAYTTYAIWTSLCPLLGLGRTVFGGGNTACATLALGFSIRATGRTTTNGRKVAGWPWSNLRGLLGALPQSFSTPLISTSKQVWNSILKSNSQGLQRMRSPSVTEKKEEEEEKNIPQLSVLSGDHAWKFSLWHLRSTKFILMMLEFFCLAQHHGWDEWSHDGWGNGNLTKEAPTS